MTRQRRSNQQGSSQDLRRNELKFSKSKIDWSDPIDESPWFDRLLGSSLAAFIVGLQVVLVRVFMMPESSNGHKVSDILVVIYALGCILLLWWEVVQRITDLEDDRRDLISLYENWRWNRRVPVAFAVTLCFLEIVFLIDRIFF